jgi:hypothetical protein
MPDRQIVQKQIVTFGGVEFEVTEDHLMLLPHVKIHFNADGYNGHTAQDSKRPYGNSGYVSDEIHECLGGDPNVYDREGELPDELDKKYIQLHQDMEKCLQILVQNGEIKLGKYSSVNYFKEWIKGGLKVCGKQDDAGDVLYGTCNLPEEHDGWHQEWRDGKLWAEWRYSE